MFQIVEIHQAALSLRRGIERVIGLNQFCQPIQRRGGHGDIRRRVVRIERKRGLYIADCFLERVAPRLNAVGNVFIENIRLFLAPQRGKRDAMYRDMQGGVTFFRLFRQIFRQMNIRFARRRVMRWSIHAQT